MKAQLEGRKWQSPGFWPGRHFGRLTGCCEAEPWNLLGGLRHDRTTTHYVLPRAAPGRTQCHLRKGTHQQPRLGLGRALSELELGELSDLLAT